MLTEADLHSVKADLATRKAVDFLLANAALVEKKEPEQA